jgi:hypothetical protein
MTVPLIVVVFPAVQVGTSLHSPVHETMSPHCPEMPPPPQMLGETHDPQLSEPPQPSPHGPQVKPSFRQVVGTHAVLCPHLPGIPPPPHVSPGTLHDPHASASPQPSPAGPQVIPCEAQVMGTQ